VDEVTVASPQGRSQLPIAAAEVDDQAATDAARLENPPRRRSHITGPVGFGSADRATTPAEQGEHDDSKDPLPDTA
jgi:hypothetical protein